MFCFYFSVQYTRHIQYFNYLSILQWRVLFLPIVHHRFEVVATKKVRFKIQVLQHQFIQLTKVEKKEVERNKDLCWTSIWEVLLGKLHWRHALYQLFILSYFYTCCMTCILLLYIHIKVYTHIHTFMKCILKSQLFTSNIQLLINLRFWGNIMSMKWVVCKFQKFWKMDKIVDLDSLKKPTHFIDILLHRQLLQCVWLTLAERNRIWSTLSVSLQDK